MAASEMRRELITALTKTAQVDDSPHPCRTCRGCEVASALAVLLFERARRTHRMNQVVCGRNVLESRRETCGIERVAANDFSFGGHVRAQVIRPPREGSPPHSGILKLFQEVPAHGSRRAGEQHNCPL